MPEAAGEMLSKRLFLLLPRLLSKPRSGVEPVNVKADVYQSDSFYGGKRFIIRILPSQKQTYQVGGKHRLLCITKMLVLLCRLGLLGFGHLFF